MGNRWDVYLCASGSNAVFISVPPVRLIADQNRSLSFEYTCRLHTKPLYIMIVQERHSNCNNNPFDPEMHSVSFLSPPPSLFPTLPNTQSAQVLPVPCCSQSCSAMKYRVTIRQPIEGIFLLTVHGSLPVFCRQRSISGI